MNQDQGRALAPWEIGKRGFNMALAIEWTIETGWLCHFADIVQRRRSRRCPTAIDTEVDGDAVEPGRQSVFTAFSCRQLTMQPHKRILRYVFGLHDVAQHIGGAAGDSRQVTAHQRCPRAGIARGGAGDTARISCRRVVALWEATYLRHVAMRRFSDDVFQKTAVPG